MLIWCIFFSGRLLDLGMSLFHFCSMRFLFFQQCSWTPSYGDLRLARESKPQGTRTSRVFPSLTWPKQTAMAKCRLVFRRFVVKSYEPGDLNYFKDLILVNTHTKRLITGILKTGIWFKHNSCDRLILL